jgi:aryl-alcohol dehydrogenase-like predicted oxidoreductase
MDFITLGRTGLNVSVMGLGCGGHSRLGMSRGATSEEAAKVVRAALDLGVNFIDTAEVYGTEEAVGIGLEGVPRDSVVISTKVPPRSGDAPLPASELAERLDGCLRRLRTDHVDILHMHGVTEMPYPYVRDTLVPELSRLRDAGKIRFLGITEAFASDPPHRMLSTAVPDGIWDVVMTGFNIVNQSARERVLAQTIAGNVGVLLMFAVRRALTSPKLLSELLTKMAGEGRFDMQGLPADDPLGFLVGEAGAVSLADAAYRYCRHEPGVHIVLSGTGNVEHLKKNAESLMRPPLPAHHQERLRALFAGIDSESCN